MSDEIKDPIQESEKEAVNERILESRRLIKITTEPATYLNTAIISKSPVLTSMIYAIMTHNIKNSTFETNETNKYGDRCLICLPHDDIPSETWLLFGYLVDKCFTLDMNMINETTLDDLLYICFKYEISLCTMLINETGDLQPIIQAILNRKIKQNFPRTQNPKINEYYTELADWFIDSLSRFKHPKQKISHIASLEIIPPLHYAVASEIAKRAMKITKV